MKTEHQTRQKKKTQKQKLCITKETAPLVINYIILVILLMSSSHKNANKKDKRPGKVSLTNYY